MLPQRAQVPGEMPSYTEGAPPRGQLLLSHKGWVFARLHTMVTSTEGTQTTESESVGSACVLGLLGSSQGLSFLSSKMRLSSADRTHSLSASLPLGSAHCPQVPSTALVFVWPSSQEWFLHLQMARKNKKKSSIS